MPCLHPLIIADYQRPGPGGIVTALSCRYCGEQFQQVSERPNPGTVWLSQLEADAADNHWDYPAEWDELGFDGPDEFPAGWVNPLVTEV